MGVTEVAVGVVDGLKDRPTALAMIAINLVWLGAAGWFLTTINDRLEKRDAFFMEMIKKDCP